MSKHSKSDDDSEKLAKLLSGEAAKLAKTLPHGFRWEDDFDGPNSRKNDDKNRYNDIDINDPHKLKKFLSRLKSASGDGPVPLDDTIEDEIKGKAEEILRKEDEKSNSSKKPDDDEYWLPKDLRAPKTPAVPKKDSKQQKESDGLA